MMMMMIQDEKNKLICYDPNCDHRKQESTNTPDKRPEILYKYMTLKRFMESFNDYLDGKLYFAGLDSMNDPMESIPSKFRVMRVKRTHDDFEAAQKFYTKMERYKICSLTESNTNFAMWSHYAKNHTGVCVGFKIKSNEELAKIKPPVRLEKIKYVPKIPIIPQNLKGSDEELLKIILCTKLEPWHYEQEWRLFAERGNAGMLEVGEVAEIILGYKCPLDLTKLKPITPDKVSKVKLRKSPAQVCEAVDLVVDAKTEETSDHYLSGDWEYTVTNGEAAIEGYYGMESNIDIPSHIDSLPVVTVKQWGFAGHIKLVSITIPEGVREIEWNVFAYCTGLVSISIPKNVTKIGDAAFAGCTALDVIDVDTDNPCYSSIDGVLFDKTGKKLYACPAGKKGTYTVPEGVTEISNAAFEGCANLTSVIIPSSVSMIGVAAFAGCSELSAVNIPEGVTEIGYNTFAKCAKLTAVVIPSSVVEIGITAFAQSGITSITIPSGVRIIGTSAFALCPALIDVAIAEGVEEIGDGAFEGCEKLRRVNIPGSVMTIKDYAFSGCLALACVTFGEGSNIEEGSFGKGAFFKDPLEFLSDVISLKCEYLSSNPHAGTYMWEQDKKMWRKQ